MRVILLALLAVCFNVSAGDKWRDILKRDIENAKYQKLSVCMFVGDIASNVQQIKHEGDTLAMFEARASRILKGQPEWQVYKIMQIGRDVYHNTSEDMKRSDIFVIYYTDCINNYEAIMADQKI